ncbi:MAG: hypothetical protein AAFW46_00900 [Pseudomonadota bacterium]
MQRLAMTAVAALASLGVSIGKPDTASAQTEFSVTLDSNGGVSATVSGRDDYRDDYYDQGRYAEPVQYRGRRPVVVVPRRPIVVAPRRPVVVAPRRFYRPHAYAPRRAYGPRGSYAPRRYYAPRRAYGPPRLGPRARYWRREAIRARRGY